jgi:hypothetical protein
LRLVPEDLAVVETEQVVTDLLCLLVSLAGDDDEVVLARKLERPCRPAASATPA